MKQQINELDISNPLANRLKTDSYSLSVIILLQFRKVYSSNECMCVCHYRTAVSMSASRPLHCDGKDNNSKSGSSEYPLLYKRV